MPKLEVRDGQPTGSERLRFFTAAQARNEAFPNGVRDITLEVLTTGEEELRRQLAVAGVTDLDVQGALVGSSAFLGGQAPCRSDRASGSRKGAAG